MESGDNWWAGVGWDLDPAWHLQKALVLDQDCTVLADQEVRLENRITFE